MSTKLLTLFGGKLEYFFRDEFTTDRAAGAIDGTACEPGLATALGTPNRLVLDDGSDMTIVDGWLRVAPGSGWGNPGYTVNQAIATVPGRQLLTKVRPYVKGNLMFGWDADTDSVPSAGIYLTSTIMLAYNAPEAPEIGSGYSVDQEYNLTLIQRKVGVHFYIQGGTEYPEQTLVWSSDINETGNQYARIVGGADSQMRFAYVRIPSKLWLPTPVISDGFASWGTSDGLGHAEGVAGGDALGQGGNGVAWTDRLGTWGAAAGVASCSLLDDGVGIATAPGAVDINISVTPTRAGDSVGLVVRYVDADNYVLALHDGTDFVLRKVVAGTPTDVDSYTGALGQIQVHVHGSSFLCYLDKALQCSGTIADAALQSSALCGLYTTNSGNTFNDLLAWSRT